MSSLTGSSSAEIPSTATDKRQRTPATTATTSANGKRILESTRRRTGESGDRSPPSERVEWDSQQQQRATEKKKAEEDEDGLQRKRQWQQQSEKAEAVEDYDNDVAVELKRRAGLDDDETDVEADGEPDVCDQGHLRPFPRFFRLTLFMFQIPVASTSARSSASDRVTPGGGEDDTEDEEEAPSPVVIREIPKARGSSDDDDDGGRQGVGGGGREREDSTERVQKKAKQEEEEKKTRQEVLERMRKLKQDAKDKKAKGAKKERRGF
jgi:hypothetical protein